MTVLKEEIVLGVALKSLEPQGCMDKQGVFMQQRLVFQDVGRQSLALIQLAYA